MITNDLISLVEECDTFNEKEKEFYIKKISENKLTKEEKRVIGQKIYNQLNKDREQLAKLDQEIFRYDRTKNKLERFSQRIIGKIENLMYRDNDLRLRKIESFLDNFERQEAEEEKREEKDIEYVIKKMQEKVDKKKTETILKNLK